VSRVPKLPPVLVIISLPFPPPPSPQAGAQGGVHGCLRTHHKELSEGCRAEQLHLEQSEAESVELRPSLIRACVGERQLFCKDVRPGNARVFRCAGGRRGSRAAEARQASRRPPQRSQSCCAVVPVRFVLSHAMLGSRGAPALTAAAAVRGGHTHTHTHTHTHISPTTGVWPTS
jgi:hypothetical protein